MKLPASAVSGTTSPVAGSSKATLFFLADDFFFFAGRSKKESLFATTVAEIQLQDVVADAISSFALAAL